MDGSIWSTPHDFLRTRVFQHKMEPAEILSFFQMWQFRAQNWRPFVLEMPEPGRRQAHHRLVLAVALNEVGESFGKTSQKLARALFGDVEVRIDQARPG